MKRIALTEDPYLLFRTMAVLFVSGVVIGSFFYGQPFLFWKYPYSYLGTVKTVSGYPNLRALFIFDTTMITCAVFFFKIGLWYHSRFEGSALKEVVAYAGAVGALIMLIPCDTYNFYHSIGSSLFVFSVWLFMQGNLVKIKTFYSKTLFVVMLLLTEGGILPYAWAHINKNPVEYSLQKLAVWGCFGGLVAGSYMLDQKKRKSRKSSRKTEVFDFK